MREVNLSFNSLDENKKSLLMSWINENFIPIEHINTRTLGSYALKHIAENSIGFYISESQFIVAMQKCGFKSSLDFVLEDDEELTRGAKASFNISSKSNAIKLYMNDNALVC